MSFDLVLFGGTGDLAWRKLMPALFQAFRHGSLPEGGRIIGVARDDEAAAIWKQVAKLPDDHIHYGITKDNFWEMGETGPCGPCTEMHFDLGPDFGPGGGPAGDLYVEVHERPHDVFTRDGEDLHCRVTLPMTSAALGTTLTLDTLDGEADLDIKPGTQSGSVLTLRAQGAPRLRATGRGNLVVHVEVMTPTRLDPEQEKLLRELAALRGEDQPESHREAQGGLFSRVRDAFNGR